MQNETGKQMFTVGDYGFLVPFAETEVRVIWMHPETAERLNEYSVSSEIRRLVGNEGVSVKLVDAVVQLG